MRMRKYLKFALSFLATLFVIALIFEFVVDSRLVLKKPDPNIEKYIVIETKQGTQHHFDVELALTLEEVRKGLMDRSNLPRNKGMFFIFGESGERKFWMKNTRIPLDIIFIRSDGIIHKIHRNAKPFDKTLIPSEGAVLGVLEINGGLAGELGIAKGDIVHHSEFGNQLKNNLDQTP